MHQNRSALTRSGSSARLSPTEAAVSGFVTVAGLVAMAAALNADAGNIFKKVQEKVVANLSTISEDETSQAK